jgi:hypothetical protein
VPHCPGSVGFEIFDRTTALFYTGDVCLSTARHGFAPEFLDRVRTSEAPRKTVLIDATMAGRPAGASGIDAAGRLLDAAGGADDVVLVSADASQLMYAYLDLFFTATRSDALRHRLAFVMTADARTLFDLVHAAFIDRYLDEVDPFLASQHGTLMSAWGESRSLYRLDQLRSLPSEQPRLWFLGPTELERFALGQRCFGVVIGRRPPEVRVSDEPFLFKCPPSATPPGGHRLPVDVEPGALAGGVRAFGAAERLHTSGRRWRFVGLGLLRRQRLFQRFDHDLFLFRADVH